METFFRKDTFKAFHLKKFRLKTEQKLLKLNSIFLQKAKRSLVTKQKKQYKKHEWQVCKITTHRSNLLGWVPFLVCSTNSFNESQCFFFSLSIFGTKTSVEQSNSSLSKNFAPVSGRIFSCDAKTIPATSPPNMRATSSQLIQYYPPSCAQSSFPGISGWKRLKGKKTRGLSFLVSVMCEICLLSFRRHRIGFRDFFS